MATASHSAPVRAHHQSAVLLPTYAGTRQAPPPTTTQALAHLTADHQLTIPAKTRTTLTVNSPRTLTIPVITNLITLATNNLTTRVIHRIPPVNNNTPTLVVHVLLEANKTIILVILLTTLVVSRRTTRVANRLTTPVANHPITLVVNHLTTQVINRPTTLVANHLTTQVINRHRRIREVPNTPVTHTLVTKYPIKPVLDTTNQEFLLRAISTPPLTDKGR